MESILNTIGENWFAFTVASIIVAYAVLYLRKVSREWDIDTSDLQDKLGEVPDKAREMADQKSRGTSSKILLIAVGLGAMTACNALELTKYQYKNGEVVVSTDAVVFYVPYAGEGLDTIVNGARVRTSWEDANSRLMVIVEPEITVVAP